MIDFIDYSRYKNFGVVIGVVLNACLLVVFLSVIFLFRTQVIYFVRENIIGLLVILSFSLYLYLKLWPTTSTLIKKSAKTSSFITGLNDGFSKPSFFIGSVINFLLLFLVYILAIGPISLLSKTSKKKFLQLDFSTRKKSYWQKSYMGQERKEDYYRQF